MCDESKSGQSGSGSEPKSKIDELIDKTKAFADKAEELVGENVEKIKKSGTFEKAAGLVDKVGDYVEDKVDEFQRGEAGTRFEKFKEKAEDQAEDLYEKGKSVVNLIVDDVEEAIDKLKGKANRKDNPQK